MSSLLYGPRNGHHSLPVLTNNQIGQGDITALSSYARRHPYNPRLNQIFVKTLKSGIEINHSAFYKCLAKTACHQGDQALISEIIEAALDQNSPNRKQLMTIIGRWGIGGIEGQRRIILESNYREDSFQAWGQETARLIAGSNALSFDPILSAKLGAAPEALRQQVLAQLNQINYTAEWIEPLWSEAQGSNHWQRSIRETIISRLLNDWAASSERERELGALMGLFGLNTKQRDAEANYRLARQAIIDSSSEGNLANISSYYRDALARRVGIYLGTRGASNSQIIEALSLASGQPMPAADSPLMKIFKPRIGESISVEKWQEIILSGLMIENNQQLPGQIKINPRLIANALGQEITIFRLPLKRKGRSK